MTFVVAQGPPALGLDGWVGRQRDEAGRRRARCGRGDVLRGLRFAFYGRTSTVDYQDRFSSHGWQREVAEELIADHGALVAEFFDVGCPRRLSWSRRPQASALLAALPDRQAGRFDAVVVGEYERAFASGEQFLEVAGLLERHGAQLWLPEAGGRVDIGSPAHEALMTVLGAQSRREVARSRHRVLAAMRAQVREQGRYLGGRPPYGYRLADAGPHPNRAHAEWGRRLRRLEPDPDTAPHVRWMFERRLAGCSVAGIARELTERGVLCPSEVDPSRNAHRCGAGWALRTVAAILANPRYTGRQVWDRQRAEQPGERASRRSRPAEWTISTTMAHPALISEAEFVAAQQVKAVRATKNGCSRRYLLSGIVQCALCGRRLDSHWVHGRAGYRCRHGYTSSRPRPVVQPKSIYVREDVLLAELSTRPTAELDHCTQSNAAAMVAQLRADGLTIVHDGTCWEIAGH